jgi:hypothetical protein
VNQLGQLGEKPFLEFGAKLNLIDSFGYLGRDFLCTLPLAENSG